jgi:hypothetical protein
MNMNITLELVISCNGNSELSVAYWINRILFIDTPSIALMNRTYISIVIVDYSPRTQTFDSDRG